MTSFIFSTGDPIRHTQQTITVAYGPTSLDIEVDELLVPLTEALWRKGYRTVASCQDEHGKGKAWVGFETRQMAVAFRNETRQHGARLIQVTKRAFADALPDDPFRHGAVAVSFPTQNIDQITDLFKEKQ